MTELAEQAPSVAVSASLLPLKLSPPPVRADEMLRRDLHALLAEARLMPVTLVVAPAGYGKTTLLAQWADEFMRTGAQVAWISFEANDQEPSLLLAYLIGAIQRVLPRAGEQALRMLQSLADLERNWPLVAGALLSEVQRELQSQTMLILDDVHLVSDGPITNDLLGYLLRAAPPNLHILMASRRPLVFAPLPRLRAEGLLLEVGANDLLLQRHEAIALLERAGVSLTNDELDLLLERTGGWMLSVQLAVRTLARQTPEQRRAYLQGLVSNQHDLFAYLASEVLAALPPRLVDRLICAALLGQVNPSLLDEALGVDDSAQMIEQAITLGLPLTVDTGTTDGERIFRFHPLWQRLLADRALSRFDRVTVRELHERFGMVLARHDQIEQALRHLAAAGNPAAIARALREHAWPLIDSPQRESLRNWIERLPPEVREHDPELLHMQGWSLFNTDRERALRLISQAAEQYRLAGAPAQELRALRDMAVLLFWSDAPAEFASVCRRVIAAAARANDVWSRGAALVGLMALAYSQGRFRAALRIARWADRRPLSVLWQWLLAALRASIYTQQGCPAEALAAINAALELPRIDRNDMLRQSLLLLQAMALYQQGKHEVALDQAQECYYRLNDYAPGSVLAGNAALILALLLIENDRSEEAATYLQRVRQVVAHFDDRLLGVRARIVEIYGLLRTQQPTAAAQAIAFWHKLREQSATSLQQFPHGEGTFLNSHDLWMQSLLLIAIGEGGECDQALAMANDLLSLMGRHPDGLFRALTHIYRAYLVAQRQSGSAVIKDDLQTACTICDRAGVESLPFLPRPAMFWAIKTALQLGLSSRAMIAALRRFDTATLAAIVTPLLDESFPVELRVLGANLIGDLSLVNAYSTLRNLLKDRSPQVRLAASEALERLVYRPPYRLTIRALGGFQVLRGDQEVRDRDWRSVKARQLLQLLLIERGRMLPREQIMDMLWPGLDSESASNNLRVTISRLIKALEPDRPEGAPTYYILQQGDTYGFNVESDHVYDVAMFVQAVEQGRRELQRNRRAEARDAFQSAVSLYSGQFLPDSLYEDWSVVERERLALLFNDAALSLGRILFDEGKYHDAIALGWRVLEYDKAQEEAYQLLIRAYGAIGERSTAIRLYQRCVTELRDELGVEPLPETVALFEQVRGRRAS
ncbi:BTAD domain-containing putative transcriptional regulator [Chloroflexus sp.]|uniref:BTAD domain-containing putative transcriptional regulator n=1 Tax=Chloroflexus sp. TaxID=1904827 RepID=UPI00298EE95C|nr:BTAD domain-containing putative transcriptional regulator [Chloroflexus sp.]MDW8402936.1 BTAD domain-containing putative transcriptional regulator [Chloroflexus sp.]